jgi:hypothetical protein
MAPPIPKFHAPVNELSQSSLEGKGVVCVNHVWASAGGSAIGDAGPAGHGPAYGPAPLSVDLFSCQRSEARQTARLRRAAGARSRPKSICERCGSVAASGIFREARVPKSIVQDGKKGFRSLMIVFMEIPAVTRFFRREKRGDQRVFPYHCRNKVTGEMGVKTELRRKAGIFRRKNVGITELHPGLAEAPRAGMDHEITRHSVRRRAAAY